MESGVEHDLFERVRALLHGDDVLESQQERGGRQQVHHSRAAIADRSDGFSATADEVEHPSGLDLCLYFAGFTGNVGVHESSEEFDDGLWQLIRAEGLIADGYAVPEFELDLGGLVVCGDVWFSEGQPFEVDPVGGPHRLKH